MGHQLLQFDGIPDSVTETDKSIELEVVESYVDLLSQYNGLTHLVFSLFQSSLLEVTVVL